MKIQNFTRTGIVLVAFQNTFENMAAIELSNCLLKQVTHQNVRQLILMSLVRFLTTIAQCC